jgi:hypothetical protein
MEKTHCSSLEMHSYCKLCLIKILILPTHVFEEGIIETSKFIAYSYNIQIIHILVHWNPLENEDKIHKKFNQPNNRK